MKKPNTNYVLLIYRFYIGKVINSFWEIYISGPLNIANYFVIIVPITHRVEE